MNNPGLEWNVAFPGHWPRHSSSTPFGPPVAGQFNTQVTPHERVSIESISSNGVVMEGYAYHLFFNGNDMSWIPFDPTGSDLATKAKFAYSLLLHDDQNGVSDLTGFGLVTVFPNPASNTITLQIGSEADCKAHYTVRGIDGRTEQVETDWALESGVNRRMIDLNRLAPGVHLLQGTVGIEVFNVKFIKL